MSKCSEIRDFCGDYAFDVEYSEDNKFTMFFNSRRNAETVKRCIEVDDSVPNAETAVDFVEVVRCKDCKHYDDGECRYHSEPKEQREYERYTVDVNENDYCSYGERRSENEG
jgi:hypothetical protein